MLILYNNDKNGINPDAIAQMTFWEKEYEDGSYTAQLVIRWLNGETSSYYGKEAKERYEMIVKNVKDKPINLKQ